MNFLTRKQEYNRHFFLPLMWDSPLNAVNMYHYHWLIKKLFQPIAGLEAT